MNCLEVLFLSTGNNTHAGMAMKGAKNILNTIDHTWLILEQLDIPLISLLSQSGNLLGRHTSLSSQNEGAFAASQ